MKFSPLNWIGQRGNQILLLVGLYVAVHVVEASVVTFFVEHGLYLIFSMALKLFYIGATFYLLSRKEFFSYGIVIAFVAFSVITAGILLFVYIHNFGTFAFSNGHYAIENYLRIAEIIIGMPTLVALFSLYLPLYRVWSNVKKQSDAGLVSLYTATTREAYRQWMTRDLAGYSASLQTISFIFYEMKKRDPKHTSLYWLLKEPDDWVKIMAARQLLGRKDGEALQTLEAIGAKNSEWSAYARKMASDWTEGKLKPWK